MEGPYESVARLMMSGWALTPESFDQNVAMAAVFPMRSHVHSAASGRKFPMSRFPDVATFMPEPVTLNPDMMVRRTGDDDFLHGRRRCVRDDHLGAGYDRRRRGALLPVPSAQGITIFAGFPMRSDK